MPRAPKLCGELDCDARVSGGTTYCPAHEAASRARVDAKRGNARQRGYDTHHDREAVAAKREAVMLGLLCPRCHEPMTDVAALDYGHTKARAYDPTSHADRVEHSHCNRSAQHRMG